MMFKTTVLDDKNKINSINLTTNNSTITSVSAKAIVVLQFTLQTVQFTQN